MLNYNIFEMWRNSNIILRLGLKISRLNYFVKT